MLYLNDHLYDFSLPEALAELSEQRRLQALRYKHEQGQRTCAAAYLLLCEGLRREYGITEKPLFEYGEHGKPAIVGHPEIHFNLSHCSEAAICLLSNHPVGVDVEAVRPLREGVLRYAMNDDEVQQVLHAERPDIEFTRLWTMKEAVVKASGRGIDNNLKTVLQNIASGLTTIVSPDARYVYSIYSEP